MSRTQRSRRRDYETATNSRDVFLGHVPTMEVVTYCSQLQRMLSDAMNGDRTLTLGHTKEWVTVKIVGAAIGDDGRCAFTLAINEFVFNGKGH